MPYIITTTRKIKAPALQSAFMASSVSETTRHAVATLDEARETVATQHRIEYADGRTARDLITESGGTVGPLPDGSVIEVEQTTWARLANAAALGARRLAYVTSPHYGSGEPYAAEILDAFNNQGERT